MCYEGKILIYFCFIGTILVTASVSLSKADVIRKRQDYSQEFNDNIYTPRRQPLHEVAKDEEEQLRVVASENRKQHKDKISETSNVPYGLTDNQLPQPTQVSLEEDDYDDFWKNFIPNQISTQIPQDLENELKETFLEKDLISLTEEDKKNERITNQETIEEMSDIYNEAEDDEEEEAEDSDTSNKDSLVESLRIFLGEISGDEHNFTDEIDFGDISKLNTFRQIGKEAHIPQELVDAVNPQADENLLELIVRIAEHPTEWQKIHRALSRLDQAITTTNRIKKSFYGEKEVGKRSSTLPNRNIYLKHKKERNKAKGKHKHKLKGRRNKNRHAVEENKSKHKEKEQKPRGRIFKERKKPLKHKFKNKQPEDYLFSQNRTNDDVKLRHNYNHHIKDNFGTYSQKSIESIIEKPNYAKLRTHAAAPLPGNTNVHYGQWKFSHPDADWPIFDKPKQSSKLLFDNKFEAKIHHIHDEASYNKKIQDMTRWGLLKQKSKNVKVGLDDMGSYNNDIDSWSQEKTKDIPVHALEKEKILATNRWPTPQGQKENAWPQFSYHRVTSSPTLQQRDLASQPRRKSAYIAVSAIPTNPNLKPPDKTGMNGEFFNSKSSKSTALPDLFDRLVSKVNSTDVREQRYPRYLDKYKDQLTSLKVMDKFNTDQQDEQRLREVMRDATRRHG